VIAVQEENQKRIKMHKKIWISSAIAIALIVSLVVFWTSRNQKTGAIVIGSSLPLTGDAGVYGQAIKKGMELAAEELAQAGNIIFHIKYEDDQGKPSASVSAINKLINVDKVSIIIGGAMSSTAEPVIPITEKSKVILVSPTATKASLTDNTRYFFRLWPSDNYDGQIMAEIAYNKLHLRKVAVLYVNVAYGQGITKVFEREFKKLGGKITVSESYLQGATDFRAQIEKIRASKPDAVYIPGYVREISNLLKQARELAFQPLFLGVNSLYDPKLLETAGEAAEGAIFTYPIYDSDSTKSIIATFVASFKKKYGRKPDVFAAQGYDSVRVVAKAIKVGGGTTAEQVRNGLLSMKEYKGPGGAVIFEPNGDVRKPLRLLTIRDGQFVPFE